MTMGALSCQHCGETLAGGIVNEGPHAICSKCGGYLDPAFDSKFATDEMISITDGAVSFERRDFQDLPLESQYEVRAQESDYADLEKSVRRKSREQVREMAQPEGSPPASEKELEVEYAGLETPGSSPRLEVAGNEASVQSGKKRPQTAHENVVAISDDGAGAPAEEKPKTRGRKRAGSERVSRRTDRKERTDKEDKPVNVKHVVMFRAVILGVPLLILLLGILYKVGVFGKKGTGDEKQETVKVKSLDKEFNTIRQEFELGKSQYRDGIRFEGPRDQALAHFRRAAITIRRAIRKGRSNIRETIEHLAERGVLEYRVYQDYLEERRRELKDWEKFLKGDMKKALEGGPDKAHEVEVGRGR